MRTFGSLVLAALVVIPMQAAPAARLGRHRSHSRTLAFERVSGPDKGVYLVNADGSGTTRITSGLNPSESGYGVSWAPNSQRFVFAAKTPGGNTSRLFIVRRDGTNLHDLTSGGTWDGDRMPQWCPTGGQVVFVRETAEYVRVFAIRVEGDGWTSVSVGTDPHWFPGGGKVVFSANGKGQHYELFKETVPADYNHNRWQISESPHGSDAINVAPDIAPGGRRIVYVRMFEPYRYSTRHWALRVMQDDGSRDHLVVKGRRGFPDPEWSPGGHRLVFVGRRRKNNDIYVIRGDGKGYHRLTRSRTSEFDPTWSPDGSRIAFVSTRDGNREIYVMHADGSHKTRVTFSESADAEPVWAP